jgi:hypothetical protein
MKGFVIGIGAFAIVGALFLGLTVLDFGCGAVQNASDVAKKEFYPDAWDGIPVNVGGMPLRTSEVLEDDGTATRCLTSTGSTRRVRTISTTSKVGRLSTSPTCRWRSSPSC